MTTWFISRHQGAIDWIKQQKIQIDRFETHLDTDLVEKNDIVIGTLPVHLAAEICAKGANFYFLTINTSFEQRGQELSATQLNEIECSIQPFWVEKIIGENNEKSI